MKKEPLMVHCDQCHHEWAVAMLPAPAEAIGKLKHIRCPACNCKRVLVGEYPKPTDEGDPFAWLTNGDTGTSSLTIWHVMMRRQLSANFWPGVPLDPSDFGRCYRLLKVMPSWRSRLNEVAEEFPKWRPLVDAWDELTALYERDLPTGRCHELYVRMAQLRGEA